MGTWSFWHGLVADDISLWFSVGVSSLTGLRNEIVSLMNHTTNVGIIANLTKSEAVARSVEVAECLRSFGASVFWESTTAQACNIDGGYPLRELAKMVDVIVVLGGDGTILRTAQMCGEDVKPLAALNTGRLGFLTTATQEEMDSFAEAIASRNFELSWRSLISAEFMEIDGTSVSLAGMNEVTLTRGASSRLIRLEMAVDGVPLNRFNGDGLIVATPTGSTAYSLSAGGPIVSPQAEIFLITPICPHALSSRAFVTEDRVTLTITADDQPEEILLTVDGGTPVVIQRDKPVTLRKAAYKVPLVVINKTTFYDVLQQKLRWMSTTI